LSKEFNIPDKSSRLLKGGRVIRPGVVIYLLALFIELLDMLGNTYLWRLDELFCLKPALRAVFIKVFFAKPLNKNIKIKITYKL